MSSSGLLEEEVLLLDREEIGVWVETSCLLLGWVVMVCVWRVLVCDTGGD